MTGATKYDTAISSAIERIRSIEWTIDGHHVRCSYALMHEYLCRSADWTKALGRSTNWPFFDVCDYFENVPALPRPVSDVVSQVVADAGVPWFYTEKVCQWYIRWCIAESFAVSETLRLEAMYEPLMRLYERGMTFTVEKGFVSINGYGGKWIGSIEQYMDSRCYFCLDDASLDRLDRMEHGLEDLGGAK